MLVANFYYPPDYEYGEIARNIVTGKGFSRTIVADTNPAPTSSHAPFYPYFLSLFYRAGNKPFIYFLVQLLQAIFSTLTIYIIYKTSQILFNSSVAHITEWLVALYPPLIYYCTKLVPTTIFLFFLCLSIYLIMKNENFFQSLLSGIFLGIAILCDPVALVIYPAIFVWFLISKKINFVRMTLILFVSIIILIPWTIRNYRIHKTLVPITTQFGVNLWIGNNANATGTDFYEIKSVETQDYILVTQTLPSTVQDSLNRLSEINRAKFFLYQAFDFMVNNPHKFIVLLVKKCYYYLWFPPATIYASTDLQKYRILLYISYIPILVLGIAGILLSIRGKKPVLLILLCMMLISGLYVGSHVGLIRYRIPVELYLLCFSGYFIYSFRR
ncbi:MAG: glycosyltransferase family 39 protein [candidate division WOR-3 bacterium]